MSRLETAAMKDVSLRIKGRDRHHIEAIQKELPVSQLDIIGAALRKFRDLPFTERAEALRRLSEARAPRNGRRKAEPSAA
jgi:hypothetical protein